MNDTRGFESFPLGLISNQMLEGLAKLFERRGLSGH